MTLIETLYKDTTTVGKIVVTLLIPLLIFGAVLWCSFTLVQWVADFLRLRIYK